MHRYVHTDEEVWKNIPNYEGYYQASNKGRIRSVDRVIERSDGVVILAKGVIMSPSVRKGRKSISLCIGGKSTTFGVPRLIALTFLGECPKGMEVDHIDENPSNNNVENLRYMTHFENASRSTKGRFRKKCGNKMENNPRSKSVVGYINGEEVVRYKCAKYLTNVYGINYSTLRFKLQHGGIVINKILFKYADIRS